MRNDPNVKQQMFLMIESWQQSGISQKAFCEQQGVKFHTFYYWYKRYRNEHIVGEGGTPGFVKLQVETTSAAAIEIHFPGGTRMFFHQPVSAGYLKTIIG